MVEQKGESESKLATDWIAKMSMLCRIRNNVEL